MGSKLPNENKQPLSESQHFKCFQTSPASPRTKMGQKDDAGSTSPVGKKELDRQTKEVCLQEPLRRLEEKKEKLIKEKIRILEGRELVIQQEKILKDMQIKINHLREQLKHLELIGFQGREVYKCPSSPTQKTAMVKRTQKSSYLKKFCFSLGNSLWLFVWYLLYCVCLCLTLLLVYKHLPDPTWVYQLDIPVRICHQTWTY